MLTKEAIEEFKNLYKQKFQIELTDDEAYQKASNLLSLFRVVYGDVIFGKDKNEYNSTNTKRSR